MSLSRSQKRILREVAKCDYLVVGSNFIKKSYIEKGFAPQKIYVINYGVDLSKFRQTTTKQEEENNSTFRVICVAQISIRKGHVDLFRCLETDEFAKLRTPFYRSYQR